MIGRMFHAPIWAPWWLRGVGSVIDRIDWLHQKIGTSGMVALVVAVPMLVVGIAIGRASAAGILIPGDRHDWQCERLGYPPDCEFQYDGGTTRGLLTIEVNDGVGEPNIIPFLPGVPAARLTVEYKKARYSRIYQTNDGDGYWYEYPTTPPCITIECSIQKLQNPLTYYYGPTEAELAAVVSAQLLAGKLLWQIPDDEMVAALQAATGRTGVPIVTKVRFSERRGFTDGTGEATSTVVVAKAYVRWVIPQGPYPPAIEPPLPPVGG